MFGKKSAMNNSSDKLFFIDELTGFKKSYKELHQVLNREELVYSKFADTGNAYHVFYAIIVSLVLDREIILKPENLLPENTDADCLSLPNPCKGMSLEDIFQKIRQPLKWSITIYTSGTTGVPKQVVHSFQNITRSVKVSADRADDMWLFAYNAVHMAGLQVFFQAFLNQNTLINAFGYQKEPIWRILKQAGVTHISATPTFYKMLLPCAEVFEVVKQITFGGEKFSPAVLESLQKIFPKARFTNVYASSEAGSVFSANGEYFTVKAHNSHAIRILDNELLLHKSLLGSKHEAEIEGEWYHTGDMVEMISENPLAFKFTHRKSEMINVGGSKVNPNEVEDVLLSMDGVADVRVYGRANSLMGNVLCADVLLHDETLDEKSVKNYLKEKLMEYQVPRIIKFVKHLDATHTGKKKRS
ncbi:MAG: AMP-binding protein [Chitinophagaceae bacterium]|nr:AMP-binding protein [Chitinophagaceae bacterium]